MPTYRQIATGQAASVAAGSVTAASIAAGTGLKLADLQATVTTEFDLGNPSGTASTSIMMGFGNLGTPFAFTPTRTGILKVVIRGAITNSTAGDGAYIPNQGFRYYTGAGVANGSAATGTAFGPSNSANGTIVVTNANPGAQSVPFYLDAIVPGLTLNTLYKFDVLLSASVGGTASLNGCTGSIGEIF